MDVVARARALATSGQRPDALTLLSERLATAPDDTDARTLRGTILSWEGRYDEARAELDLVLDAIPGHRDALRAIIKVELWSGHPDRAEALAREALARDPDAVDLLLDHARALHALGRASEARAKVDRALVAAPGDADALALRRVVDAARRRWEVGASTTLDAFNDDRPSWFEGIAYGQRTTRFGSVVLRDYQARRFGLNDNQVEVEAFPTFREGTYADVACAYSPIADLYPTVRVQVDAYQSLGHGFEASLGYRRLQFDTGVDVYVATLSRYQGSWLFSARSFLTPGVTGTGVSVLASARRYFRGDTAWVGVRGGYGSSTEELRDLNDVTLLRSNTVGLEASLLLLNRWEIWTRDAVSQQDQASGGDLRQVSASVGTGWRF